LAPPTKEVGGFPMRYGQGPPQMGPARPPRKCFYCFETDHLFLFCPKKTEDKKKGLILVDKFMVRFANGEPIPMECHDLAKWLSHYLYFFSFSFLLSWTYYTEGSVGKCHVTSVT